MDICCADWFQSIFYCYLLSENSYDGNSDCCLSAVVTKTGSEYAILFTLSSITLWLSSGFPHTLKQVTQGRPKGPFDFTGGILGIVVH